MSPELEKQFVERWPKWFDIHGSIQHTLMPFGFAVGDGWFDLLWRLCVDLEPLAGPTFEVVQVKEKFGRLRFYIEGGGGDFEKIFQRINQAEKESGKTCEQCGKPGKIRGTTWLRAVCDACDKGDD